MVWLNIASPCQQTFEHIFMQFTRRQKEAIHHPLKILFMKKSLPRSHNLDQPVWNHKSCHAPTRPRVHTNCYVVLFTYSWCELLSFSRPQIKLVLTLLKRSWGEVLVLLLSPAQSPSKWWWKVTDSSTPATSTRSCAASASTTPSPRVSETLHLSPPTLTPCIADDRSSNYISTINSRKTQLSVQTLV